MKGIVLTRQKWRGCNREAVEGILPVIEPLMRELDYGHQS